MRKLFWLLPGMAMLSGCRSHPPSINILGAYFPDWLFCITGGSLTTAVIFTLLSKWGKAEWSGPPALTCPILLVLFSIGYWAVFFN